MSVRPDTVLIAAALTGATITATVVLVAARWLWRTWTAPPDTVPAAVDFYGT